MAAVSFDISSTATTTPLRVREALASADCRAALRGKLPKDALVPLELHSSGAPQKLLKALGGVDKYTNLGVLTEMLLRRAVIDQKALLEVAREALNITLPADLNPATYLTRVNNTRALMLVIAQSPLVYDTVVTGRDIEGHPDARAGPDVFEVKASGRIRSDWVSFLLQLFSYAALDSSITRVHLVLPLQAHIWSWDVAANWPKREQFRQALEDYATKASNRRPSMKSILTTSLARVEETKQAVAGQVDEEGNEPDFATAFGESMIDYVNTLAMPIGYHIGKHGGLPNALRSIEDASLSYQVFIVAPNTTAVHVSDEEIAESRQIIETQHLKIYVHSPYLINLCTLTPYNSRCLVQVLRLSQTVGAKGVVVHVGKACQLGKKEALEIMRCNILEASEAATVECPLLLETPAGQGTELLAGTPEEFFDYIASFNDARIGVCVDTCHTFASGTRPADYIRVGLNHPQWRDLLKLIHFNDSERGIGSRVDRHAIWGHGQIGLAEMKVVADLAREAGIPLICE